MPVQHGRRALIAHSSVTALRGEQCLRQPREHRGAGRPVAATAGSSCRPRRSLHQILLKVWQPRMHVCHLLGIGKKAHSGEVDSIGGHNRAFIVRCSPYRFAGSLKDVSLSLSRNRDNANRHSSTNCRAATRLSASLPLSRRAASCTKSDSVLFNQLQHIHLKKCAALLLCAECSRRLSPSSRSAVPVVEGGLLQLPVDQPQCRPRQVLEHRSECPVVLHRRRCRPAHRCSSGPIRRQASTNA